MYKFRNLLEKLEVLENQREKAKQAYFGNEDDLEIEEAFGEAVNAESAAFHRLCDASWNSPMGAYRAMLRCKC